MAGKKPKIFAVLRYGAPTERPLEVEGCEIIDIPLFTWRMIPEIATSISRLTNLSGIAIVMPGKHDGSRFTHEDFFHWIPREQISRMPFSPNMRHMIEACITEAERNVYDNLMAAFTFVLNTVSGIPVVACFSTSNGWIPVGIRANNVVTRLKMAKAFEAVKNGVKNKLTALRGELQTVVLAQSLKDYTAKFTAPWVLTTTPIKVNAFPDAFVSFVPPEHMEFAQIAFLFYAHCVDRKPKQPILVLHCTEDQHNDLSKAAQAGYMVWPQIHGIVEFAQL